MDDVKHSHTWHEVRKTPSGKQKARWVGEDGKIKSKTFLTKPQAEKYAWDQANGVINTMLGLAVSNKDLDKAIEEFLGVQRKPNTNALYERRLREFKASLPELKRVGQLTDTMIHRYHGILITQGHNAGGQSHHLRIVRTFCRFCVGKNWIAKSPFSNGPIPFKMPTSDYEGRALLPEEFERMISLTLEQPIEVYPEFDRRRQSYRVRYLLPTGRRVEVAGNIKDPAEAGRIASNKAAELQAAGIGRPRDVREVDIWLNKALRLGKETMLRISQIWGLRAKDFKEPNELWVSGIKGQDGEWKLLRPEAVAIVRELLSGRQPEERLFSYWSNVASMQSSVQRKAELVGLKGVRFHDACKVTRVSELDASGMGLGDLSEVSNTTKRVLSEHYIKSDRRKAFQRYLTFTAPAGQVQVRSGSKNGGIVTQKAAQTGLESTINTDQNASISPQISEL